MLAVIDSLTSGSDDQYQDTYDNLMNISLALEETGSDDFVILSERAGKLSCIIFVLRVSLNLRLAYVNGLVSIQPAKISLIVSRQS